MSKAKYQVIDPVNFDELTSTYTDQSSPQIKPLPGCIGYMATNTGDTIAFINDSILYPGVPGTNLGDSISVAGHYGYEFKGFFRIAFANPVGAQPQIELKQLFVPKEQNV